MYAYMTLLFILVTLAHFHFVLVVDTVPYSGALSNCRDCDVINSANNYSIFAKITV